MATEWVKVYDPSHRPPYHYEGWILPGPPLIIWYPVSPLEPNGLDAPPMSPEELSAARIAYANRLWDALKTAGICAALGFAHGGAIWALEMAGSLYPPSMGYMTSTAMIHSYELTKLVNECVPKFAEIMDRPYPETFHRRDPLILDLNGDGFLTTPKQATYFDYNGNGFLEQVGWVGLHDGLLVMDRNGNGIIDDGSELFGDQTILSNGRGATNSFQALADLDSNHDGKIDAADPAFSQLIPVRDSV
jgi:hypothetical protein